MRKPRLLKTVVFVYPLHICRVREKRPSAKKCLSQRNVVHRDNVNPYTTATKTCKRAQVERQKAFALWRKFILHNLKSTVYKEKRVAPARNITPKMSRCKLCGKTKRTKQKASNARCRPFQMHTSHFRTHAYKPASTNYQEKGEVCRHFQLLLIRVSARTSSSQKPCCLGGRNRAHTGVQCSMWKLPEDAAPDGELCRRKRPQ